MYGIMGKSVVMDGYCGLLLLHVGLWRDWWWWWWLLCVLFGLVGYCFFLDGLVVVVAVAVGVFGGGFWVWVFGGGFLVGVFWLGFLIGDRDGDVGMDGDGYGYGYLISNTPLFTSNYGFV